MTARPPPSLLRRLWRHFRTDHGHLRRQFPAAALARIEAAIGECERRHSGQICFALEAALPLSRVWRGQTPRERALEVFGALRVWDTEHNDGVLIYLLLADRDVEIVADRGIHAKVGADGWQAICSTMEEGFAAGHEVDAAVAGIGAVGAHLAAHSPRSTGSANELPDRPFVL